MGSLLLDDGREITLGERAELRDASGTCVRVLRTGAPFEAARAIDDERVMLHPVGADPIVWSLADGSHEPARMLEGRRVVVLGSTRGIGRALADACERQGADVVRHGRAVADVRDAAAIAAIVKDADVVFYCAGVSGGELADVIAINATGAQNAARAMREGARLVAVSSGVVESAPPGAAAYVASKHALEGLVFALAADAEDMKRTITAVRLGGYATDMNRGGKGSLPPPEHAVGWLLRAATDPAGEVHGRVIDARPPSPPIDVTGADAFASPLGPSPRVREALARLAEAGALHLHPDPTSRALRTAIAEKLGVDHARIAVGAGVSDLLARVLRLFARAGEKVVANAPSWPLFPRLCTELGLGWTRVPYVIDVERGRAHHDLARVLAAIDRRTRLVYLVSPANPAGAAIDEAEFARFVEKVPAHVTVVVDEAYVDYVTRPEALRAHRFVGRTPCELVVLRSFSKAHGLAALRVGYAVARPEAARRLHEAGMPFAVSRAAEAAAIAALSDDDHVARVRAHAVRMRTEHMRALAAEGIRTIESDAPFFLAAKREGGFETRSGTWTTSETTSNA